MMRPAKHERQLWQLVNCAIAVATLTLLTWVGIRGWQCANGIADGARCLSVAGLLAPLLTALGAWAIGLAVWRNEKHGPAAPFFWLIAAGLASGALSSAGDFASGRLFYIVLAWLAPLTLSFHLHLLKRPLSYLEQKVLRISLVSAVVLSLPFLVAPIPQLQTAAWFPWLRVAIRLTLVMALATGIAALWRNYRAGLPRAARRRVQILIFGSLLAFSPFVLLSLLPETLRLPVFVPYEITLPWVLLSPLAYLYADHRRRWGQAESLLRRFSVSFSLAVIFLAVYLATFALTGAPPGSPSRLLWAGALVSAAAVLIFAYLQPELAALTRWSLQGKRTPEGLVEELTGHLSMAHERTQLRKLLWEAVPAALGAPPVVLLTRHDNVLIGESPAAGAEGATPPLSLALDSTLATALTSGRPSTRDSVAGQLRGASPTEGESLLLSLTALDLFVPLVAGGALQGVLGLGAKISEDAWTADDQHVLAVLGRQAGAALQALHLLEALQAGRDEVAQAHRRLLIQQDHQLRQLARELHDGPIQQLLGVGYQLAAVEDRENWPGAAPVPPGLQRAAIRREVLAAADQLRAVVSQLRPAGLDELGLEAALRDYIAQLRRTIPPLGPRMQLQADLGTVTLPSDIALCLYRVAQEGLRNALHHAGATNVAIRLYAENGAVRLIVSDNGRGFVVPERLGEFAHADHYGLLGMQERVAWVGGHMQILSQVPGGTVVTVVLPLQGEDHNETRTD